MKVSSANMGLVLTGLILITIGLYRACPPKVDSKFLWNVGPMVAAFIVIVFAAWYFGGRKFIGVGLDYTMATTSGFLPTLVLLMPIIGFSMPLTHYFEQSISTALEGRFGYFWALLTAFGSPGGSALTGVVARLWVVKHQLHTVLLYFLSVVPLVSLTIFYIRQIGLGTDIAKEMYRINWFIAIGLMPCFWIYDKFRYR